MVSIGPNTQHGDTLIAEKAPEIVLERMVFPEPVLTQIIESWIKAMILLTLV
ncbi:hypothetical protein HYD77_00895 [Mycoplasmopsis bovis]|nr:hypothetical protein [Mycoplasmopsis bovis]QQH43520.1 hypothetical protein HYD77_00895 [Mycoplasmopsis bovis]